MSIATEIVCKWYCTKRAANTKRQSYGRLTCSVGRTTASYERKSLHNASNRRSVPLLTTEQGSPRKQYYYEKQSGLHEITVTCGLDTLHTHRGKGAVKWKRPQYPVGQPSMACSIKCVVNDNGCTFNHQFPDLAPHC